jgi:hypothetical protein
MGGPSFVTSTTGRTEDRGATWPDTSSQSREENRISVAVGPAGPVWLRETTAPSGGGVLRSQSTDGGRTWTWLISAP